MRSVAHFIVRFHKVILGIFLALFVASLCAIPFVNINKDMTTYMPTTMQSKVGVDTMDAEFGPSSEFTMMVNGLDAEQREDLVEPLEKVEGVTSVEYVSDEKADDYGEYNRGDSARYTVVCDGGTYSEEALGTYAALQQFGDQHGLDYYLDSEVIDGIMPPLGGIIAFAIVLIFVILFIMAGSWVEPFLLLGTIGIAVALNMGSNIFLPSVSDMTFTIAAILQLVLSMDYSIMLMSRFRLERKTAGTDELAMENAIYEGSRAIVSSSLTTIVGLLCLLLMTFTIGQDMGIVLAKGVFLSLVCVFAVMPAFILLFKGVMDRTAKKPFAPTMKAFTNFSYKARVPIFCLFLVLLALGFGLKSFGSASFFLTSYNEDHYVIEEVFPAGSQIVTLYHADEDDKVTAMVGDIEKMDGVKSVRAYGNTLGKESSAEDLADGMDMDETFVRLLYYDKFDGEVPDLTMNRFARFLKSDVLGNEDFADQVKGVDASQIDQLIKFTTVGSIQKKRTYSDMAKFLGSQAGMTSKQMKQLYLYYFMEKGVKAGSLSLPTFVDFLVNDVAKSKEYSKYLDDEAKAQLKQLSKFADKGNDTKKRSYSGMGKFLGMDAAQAAQLYKAYGVKKGVADLGTMTVEQFIDFLLNEVASSPEYGHLIDDATKQALQAMKSMLPAELLKKPCTPDEMYEVFADLAEQMAAMGMGDGNPPFSKETVKALYQYHWALYGDPSGITISAQAFLAFLVDDIASDPAYSSMIDPSTLANLKQVRKIVDVSVAGTKFTPKQMAKFLGMKTSDVKQLYQFYRVKKNLGSLSVSAYDLVSFLVSKKDDKEISSRMSASDLKGLTTLKSIMAGAIAGTAYSPDQMAKTFSDFDESAAMSASDLELVYLLYASEHDYDDAWTMTPYDFVNYVADDILDDERFSQFISKSDRNDLLDAQETLVSAKDKLLRENWGMMVVKSEYEVDSDEVQAFMGQLEGKLSSQLDEGHFLVGKAPMIMDMAADFLGELNFISLITALAIFLIVAITFRSLLIPLVLVLLIQTAFNLTMGLSGLFSGSTYYVALIIVQAILMGATIDYAILFTTNYRTAREYFGVQKALSIAYRHSIATIITSGSILISATFIVGLAQLGTATGQICLTISEGSAFAVLLVCLILPGVIAVLDRFMRGKKAEG